jgi:TolB-like protein/DNA-binding winged helix-turn-helix (wHTH) protein/Tfp pilus assembly protein PilF
MSSQAEIHRFADFELDLAGFELRRQGQPVKLERRPFDLLAMLVRQPGRVVPREEIIATLWPPNVIVDFDSGLNTLVRKVRSALEDSPENPRFIETVPGRGYRFVAPLLRAAPVTAASAVDSGVAADVAHTPAVPPPAMPAAAPTSAEAPHIGAPPHHGPGRTRIRATLVLLFVAVLAGIAWFQAGREARPTRIAVLPFENLTGDEKLAYLASGLAEDTSTSLSQVDLPGLRVVGVAGRSPAGPAVPIADIGRRLGVDLVVQSSLRLDGSRIRVTSRLLRAADGEQLWSTSFDRELTRVLGLQRELSVAIAEQIRQRLSPEAQAAISRRQTQNPAAYSLYLKGRYEWMQLTPASIRRAQQYFEQATAMDPDYALAWAAIAFASLTSTRTADADPAAVKPVALAALERARKLGPDLAETRYAEGYYHLFIALDPRAAEREARAAIALDHNNSQAHVLLGAALSATGQMVEARDVMRRARELDPTFALAFANSASVALLAGDDEAALEYSRQAIAINPDFWVGHLYFGQASERLGKPQDALQALSDAARLSEGHSLTYSQRIPLLTKLGRTDEARALLADMEDRAARQYVPSYAVAVAHAQVGNVDAAFDWLDRAVQRRSIGLLQLPKDPRLQPLHGDPRFAALLQRCDCVDGVAPTPPGGQPGPPIDP